MATCAEQLYHNSEAEQEPIPETPSLWVDLDVCAGEACETCQAACSYVLHPNNHGMITVLELATYALVCRRCEHPHCVEACPKEALEQRADQDGLLVRHHARCVSCGSCSLACPYGTIYPEFLGPIVQNCDFCLDRADGATPRCVETCSKGALKVHVGGPLGENTYRVGPNLVVHATRWEREKV